MSGYPQGGQPGYPPQHQPGGYPPPQQQPGGYSPPQQQPGGYPPPQQQPGGYAPPQQQPGGYPPPQQQPGGYPPPQQQPGGYPPPQQQPGGYPPPQQQPGGPPGAPPPGSQPGDADASAPPDDDPDAPDIDFKPQSLDGLQQYEGYGKVGFEAGGFLPPPPPPAYPDDSPPPMQFSSAANITSEEAREAMLAYVAEHCCYGKGAAEKMEMRNIVPSNALHYTLETFCEARSTARTEVPHAGGPVDGPYNGPPPLPWSIPCQPSQQFVSQVAKMPVPHTSEVRQCGGCYGSGHVRCCRCRGCGRVRCGSCGGRGWRTRHRNGESYRDSCFSCGGDGRKTCMRCAGRGRVTCRHCDGHGRVINYIELTVTYTNHVSDYILEETEMPDHLVREVQGVQIFEQTLRKVYPLVGFPVRVINDNSQRLLNEHAANFRHELQLNQRHILRAVPVTEIQYKFKDTETKFWVYGNERKVWAPDYPQQCCWGCTIL